MKKKNFYCTVCPRSCILNAVEIKGVVTVSGNKCPRGKAYAEKELLGPERNVSTLFIYKGEPIPVKTTKPIPVAQIISVVKAINALEIERRPYFHQVICKNILNTGADIIVCG